jgi:hypothetical protein
MSQPVDSEQIVNAAAGAIVNGSVINDSALYAAAGHAVKLGADQNDDEFLKLVVLIKAGNFVEASTMLMEIALGTTGSGSTASSDPLAGILAGVSQPAPAAPATTPAAPAVSPSATPAVPARRPRRK